MHRRQTLPHLWLMTDERQGDDLWSALARLPRGAGIVFRHYSLPAAERRMLFRQVRQVAARRRLTLLLAAPPNVAAAWGADGSHGDWPCRAPRSLRSASAHDRSEMIRAARLGADLVFVSPLFATRSHPGAPALGMLRFRMLATRSRIPVVALGGVDAKNARRLSGSAVLGWAAIDAWTR